VKKLEFKKDGFKKSRGGYSRFLTISCAKCGEFVLLYQKDGPGALKRMYFDRIFSPKMFVGLEALPFKKIPPLICMKCEHVLAVPYLYEKENRPSFRVFEGAVGKKLYKQI
jgi:hypothetical protein